MDVVTGVDVSEPEKGAEKMRYFAAYTRLEGNAPVVITECGSYSQAMRVLSMRAMQKNRGEQGWEYGTPAVLLDLSSLPINDETAFKRLLNDDPVISAVFKLGVQIGRQDIIERIGEPS